MIYSRNTEHPEPLPEEIRLSSGLIRTDSSTFTAEEIADAGYVAVGEYPEYDSDTQKVIWDGNSWQVIALTDARQGWGQISIGWESATVSGTTQPTHINVSYRRSIVQSLYGASELCNLPEGTEIIGIYWYVTDAVLSNRTHNDFRISMFNTSSTWSDSSYEVSGSKTICYQGSGSFTLPTVTGEMYIKFSTPFVYDGSSNIVVESCTSQNNRSSSNVGSLRTTPYPIKYSWTDSVGNSCNTTPTGNYDNIRPAILMNYVI